MTQDARRDAALALHRFGLGPRPGLIAAIASDPRGALLAELERPGAGRIDDPELPSSAAASRAAFEARAARQAQRVIAQRAEKEAERLKAERQAAGAVGDEAAQTAGMATDTPKPAPQAEQGPPIERQMFLREIRARLDAASAAEIGFPERLVWFWSNHFCVSAGKVFNMAGGYEREVIRPHILGRFADMLLAAEGHPAMLFYLDNSSSIGPNSVAGINRTRGLNENLAREILELHTLGVESGYTQDDVTRFACVLTGWTIIPAANDPAHGSEFIFNRRMHEPGPQRVMDKTYADTGVEQGRAVLADVARHPAVAAHVARKLARHFVADEPPPALVERVAATFRARDGDVKAMLRTIVASPEFWAPDARRAKIKKPFEYVASAVRAMGGHVDARAGFLLARSAAEMGEGLYGAQPPTGYPDRAEAWVNAGALLARMNFALALTQRRLPGVTLDLSPLAVDRAAPDAALERLLTSLLHGAASAQTRAVPVAQLANPEIRRQTPDDRGPANTDVEKLAALVIGSPEFQRR